MLNGKMFLKRFSFTIVLQFVLFLIQSISISSTSAAINNLRNDKRNYHSNNLLQLFLTNLSQESVCYGEYGCFNKTELSNEIKIANLASKLPESPEEQDVHFYFFSCRNRLNPIRKRFNVEEKDLRDIGFDPNNQTIVMVHGYTDFYNEFNWMGDLKDSILNTQNCKSNLIIVDWSFGAKAPYSQAVANTRVVGSIIAVLIQKLNNVYKTSNNDFIILGHSLGGQIVGFAGKRINNPKVRLIIGLDPAGPAFNNVTESNHLTPNDGQLVVTVHTNGAANIVDGLGIDKPLGHYSFFPNGGSVQPGCEPAKGVASVLAKGLGEGVADAFACSHRKAQEFAIYDDEKYAHYESLGYNCKDYDHFQRGHCTKCSSALQCNRWGRWFDYWPNQSRPKNWTKPIVLYINTVGKYPFSLFHYGIKVITSSDDFASFKGQLSMNLTGTIRKTFHVTINLEDQFEPNSYYTHLFTLRKSLGKIVEIKAKLLDKNLKELSTKDVWIVVERIEVTFMNGHQQSTRQSLSSIMRPITEGGKVRGSSTDVAVFRSK